MANHVLSWCRGAGMIAVLGLLPLPAAAADRPWATYAEVHSIFARFEAVPHDKRSLLQLRVRATPGETGQGGEPVRLKIATRAGVRPVSITADGFLKLPPDAELVRDNPMITTSLPAGTPLLLRPELIFVPLPLPGVSIAGLSARLDQANRTVRSQLGFWAMFCTQGAKHRAGFCGSGDRGRIEGAGRNHTIGARSTRPCRDQAGSAPGGQRASLCRQSGAGTADFCGVDGFAGWCRLMPGHLATGASEKKHPDASAPGCSRDETCIPGPSLS